MRSATLLLFLLAGTSPADDASDEEQRIRRWRDLYSARAVAMTVEEMATPPTTPMLRPEPVLTFTNPVRPDALHGAAYVWTDRGVPRLIAAVWSAEDQKQRSQRNLCYEFFSLSEHPLEVHIDNSPVVWRPQKGGLEWIDLEGAPPPAGTRALRLTQMRRLAAGWEAMGHPGEAELRLLPQPVYRYPEDAPGAVDGAIFAFVMGTDPELFVLLEAVPGEAPKTARWRIAPARFTGSPLTLKRESTVLWSDPTWEDFNRERVYDFLYGIERLDGELPPE
jgi:hypothetical protein